MTRSIADQTESELGGSRSVLVRQKRDHIELDRLLHAIDKSTGAQRQDLINSLCKLVFPHAFAEESVLWPVVRAELPDGEALTLQIEREHQEINELFTELEQIDPDAPEHRRLFDRIAAVLREDVRDEEDVLLPKLQDKISPKQLRQIGVQWEVVRRTAPTRPHPVVARRPPGERPGSLSLDHPRPEPRPTRPCISANPRIDVVAPAYCEWSAGRCCRPHRTPTTPHQGRPGRNTSRVEAS